MEQTIDQLAKLLVSLERRGCGLNVAVAKETVSE